MNTEIARKVLDEKLRALPPLEQLQRPHKGWIKAIKDALGMSSKQLAKRLGVSPPRITKLERAELDETLTLASLRKAAHALDCTLVYSFVPKKSLHHMVKERATLVATNLVNKVDHTMALEAQNLERSQLYTEIQDLAAQLVNEPKIIWNEL